MDAIVCKSFIFTSTSDGSDEGGCLQPLYLYNLYFDLRWNFNIDLRWRPRSRNLSCSQRTNLSGQLFLFFISYFWHFWSNFSLSLNTYLRTFQNLFCLFYAFLALFGPFLTLFNAKNIIFSPFRKKFPGKA